tara:strand:+ start:186 stop:374 length:189 start_codon:yes stop_codon:yes gene_type:complete
MGDKKLTPALETEYRFLKQQVDFWMEAQHKADASPSATQRYYYAKGDLTKFVRNRREEGYKI